MRTLDRWLLAPGSAAELGAVRVCVTLYGLIYAAIRLPYWLDVARLPEHRYEAVGVLATLDQPLSPGVVWALGVITIGTLAAGVGGFRWAISGPIAAIGLLVLTTHGNSWHQVFHTENLLVLHLAVLATAPAADAWARPRRNRGATRDDPRYGWAIKALMLVTVATYVLAGAAKLRVGGVGWVFDDTLINQIAHDNLRKRLLGDRWSPFVAGFLHQRWLFRPIAGATLLVELGSPLALLGGRVRQIWVGAAWLFHVGVLLLMAILFPYPLLGLAFVPFLPADRILSRIRHLTTRRDNTGRFSGLAPRRRHPESAAL